jgi:hypothetical protein
MMMKFLLLYLDLTSPPGPLSHRRGGARERKDKSQFSPPSPMGEGVRGRGQERSSPERSHHYRDLPQYLFNRSFTVCEFGQGVVA